jgi:hypothetical protein
LLKEDAWLTAKGIGTVPLIVTYDDYRAVQGVLFPHRISSFSRLSGKQATGVQKIDLNPKVADSEFAVPR